jgi:4,5-dihydroxyphthalate decarboxylase
VLELSCALAPNDRTRAILAGDVRAEGITLHATPMHPSEMFWRQLHHSEFDVSEMPMSSLTIATAQQPTESVAIPVFTVRRVYQSTADKRFRLSSTAM